MAHWSPKEYAFHLHRHPGEVPHPKPRQREKQLEGHRGGETPGTGCPLVRFRLCRVKLLDVDAKYASVKDLLDGLCAAGFIHGDKEGQVRLEVEQEKVAAYALEETFITIQLDIPDEKDSPTGE